MNMSNRRQLSFPIVSLLLGIAEIIYAYALLVILAVYIFHLSPAVVLCIYVISMSLGVLCGRVFSNKHSFLGLIMSVLAGVLITVLSFVLGSTASDLLVSITGAVTGAFMGYRGFHIQKNPRSSFAISVKYQLSGLVSLVILSVFIGKFPPLVEYRMSMYLCGLAGFILLIWTRHIRQMRSVTLDPDGHKPLVKNFVVLNRLRTFIFIVIVILIGAFQRLSELAGSVWNMFAAWIGRLLNRETSHENITDIPDASQTPPLVLPDEEQMPRESSPMFEWFLKAVVLIAVVIFLGFILFKLWKFIQKVQQHFENRKGKRTAGAPPKTAYIDIVETIEERPVKRWFPIFQRETVPTDPQQRIRYYYRESVIRARRKGYDLPANLTPMEMKEKLDSAKNTEKNEKAKLKQKRSKIKDRIIPADLFSLYNEVRYGERTVSKEVITKIDQDWEGK